MASGATWPYGFGWFLDDVAGHPMRHHGGNFAGFAPVIAQFPDDQLTIAVLANQEAVSTGAFAKRLAGAVDPRLVEPRTPIADDPAVTQRLAALLDAGAHGRLDARDFLHARAGYFEGYQHTLPARLGPLGAAQRPVLVKRWPQGDDRLFDYDVRYAARRFAVTLQLAPDDTIVQLKVEALP